MTSQLHDFNVETGKVRELVFKIYQQLIKGSNQRSTNKKVNFRKMICGRNR